MLPLVVPLNQKFREWLELFSDTGWGQNREIAREVGMPEPWVSQIRDKTRQGDIRLSTLQKIARHRRLATWELLWCIEHGVSDFPPGLRRR